MSTALDPVFIKAPHLSHSLLHPRVDKGPCQDSKVLVFSGLIGLMKLKPRTAANGFGTEIGVNHSAMQLEPARRKRSPQWRREGDPVLGPGLKASSL